MESTTLTLNKFHFVPLTERTTTRSSIVYNYANKWWVVHPEKGLAFFGKGYGSPQCNNDKSISQRLCPPWGRIEFIDRVLVPCNVADYRD